MRLWKKRLVWFVASFILVASAVIALHRYGFGVDLANHMHDHAAPATGRSAAVTDDGLPGGNDQTLHGSTDAAPAPSTASREPLQQHKGVQPWAGVSTFQELAQKLNDASLGERTELLWIAAAACDDNGQPWPKAHADDDASLRTYYRYFKRFCASYPGGDANAYYQAFLALPTSAEIMQASMLSNIDDTPAGKAAAIAGAKQMILGTKEADVVEKAGRYLSTTGDWRIGADGADVNRSSQLQAAQYLAIKMLTCRLSGGCGPGGWTSMGECGAIGRCTLYVTADEIWRYEYSPQIYQLAVKIESQLVAQRAALQ